MKFFLLWSHIFYTCPYFFLFRRFPQNTATPMCFILDFVGANNVKGDLKVYGLCSIDALSWELAGKS